MNGNEKMLKLMVFMLPAKLDWPHSLLFLPLIIENPGWNTTNKREALEDEKKGADWLGPSGLEERHACDSVGFLFTCHISRKGYWKGVQHGIINRYRPKKASRNLFPFVKGLGKGWPT